ncbi:MAG: hypothetical protein ISS57_06570 [Anaerolineales bacterium]|nr:hypothetical protein [Anaerolineales bacterium]
MHPVTWITDFADTEWLMTLSAQFQRTHTRQRFSDPKVELRAAARACPE